MTNPSNIEVICEKLVGYLRSTVDSYLRSDLVERITLLAEQYAPDNEWFIRVMNSVFELGGDLVRQDVAQNLMRLIAEGRVSLLSSGEMHLSIHIGGMRLMMHYTLVLEGWIFQFIRLLYWREYSRLLYCKHVSRNTS